MMQYDVYLQYQIIRIMNQEQVFSFRLLTSLVRLALSIAVFYSFFNDPGLYAQVCGPLAIPIDKSFFYIVIVIEIFRIFYPLIFKVAQKIYSPYSFQVKLTKIYFWKYLFVFMLKLLIVFGQTHRWKYYIHTVILQALILIFSAITDFSTYNIAEVWEILVTDSLNRVALIYEISRTFCPNFGIYWFIMNFLILGLSQIIDVHLVKKPRENILYFHLLQPNLSLNLCIFLLVFSLSSFLSSLN